MSRGVNYYDLDRLGSVWLVRVWERAELCCEILAVWSLVRHLGAENFQYTWKQLDVSTGLSNLWDTPFLAKSRDMH